MGASGRCRPCPYSVSPHREQGRIVSALAEALVAAQAELPCALGKDADGQIGQRSYRYLTLDKLIAETRPILTQHDLIITQSPGIGWIMWQGNEEVNRRVPVLVTRITHAK